VRIKRHFPASFLDLGYDLIPKTGDRNDERNETDIGFA